MLGPDCYKSWYVSGERLPLINREKTHINRDSRKYNKIEHAPVLPNNGLRILLMKYQSAEFWLEKLKNNKDKLQRAQIFIPIVIHQIQRSEFGFTNRIPNSEEFFEQMTLAIITCFMCTRVTSSR